MTYEPKTCLSCGTLLFPGEAHDCPVYGGRLTYDEALGEPTLDPSALSDDCLHRRVRSGSRAERSAVLATRKGIVRDDGRLMGI